MVLSAWILALLALLTGVLAMLTLIEKIPIKLIYYHARIRKPLIWIIFVSFCFVIIYNYFLGKITTFPYWVIAPFLVIMLGIFQTYKMHQDNWFKAVYFPNLTHDYEGLPITSEQQLAVIEYGGEIKAYPLQYVVHHHIVNDKFGDKIVSLTYCAMCRSIIPFDVTEIGPLYVASFKNANMVVADKKTKTFFQQATFKSMIGKLHPKELQMIGFQILTWKDVKSLKQKPKVAIVTASDFRPFKLPIPGLWKKVTSTELTPGLSVKDTTFPSKTRVVGVYKTADNNDLVYLKRELIKAKVVTNLHGNFTMICQNKVVNAYKNTLNNLIIELFINDKNQIEDKNTQTKWDLRGKYLSGKIELPLIPLKISDEYWFSWKKYHPKTELIKLD